MGFLKPIRVSRLAMTAFIFYCSIANAQNKLADSMINWINTHSKIDSQYIQTLHKISYRLSEINVKKSFEYYEKLSFLSDSLNFTFGKALAQLNLGVLLSNSGNFEAANNAYFKAIDHAEKSGALSLKAIALNNIGDNYNTLNDFAKCREYTYESLDINTKLKNWLGLAINYESLFHCDFPEKKYLAADKDLSTGIRFAIIANENYIYSQYYLAFGKLHAVHNHDDSANIYFNKAIEKAQLEGGLGYESEALVAKAEYLKNLSPRNKIALLDSALKIAKQTAYLEGVANISKQLSLEYEGLKNKDSSLYYYNIYRLAADSLFSEKNKRNVIIKESEWMIKRKEIENRDLKQLSALQEKEINIKNSLLLAVFICLALTFIVAFFIYKSIQSKKNRKEFDFNQKIAQMEMQILRGQMNPHFIFNSLNSINRFILQNNRAQASEYLTKFSRLVRMILQNSQASLISLESELEALALYLDMESLRFNFHFSYKISVPDDIDTSAVKVPPLILQPYAENAIWHGIMHKDEKGFLEIEVMQQNEYLFFKIVDDGIGRKQSEAFSSKSATKHKSMGLRITADRIAMIKNIRPSEPSVTINDLVNVDGSPAGTEIVIKIPVIYNEATI